MKLSHSLNENILTAKSILPIGTSFDLITRQFSFGSLNAYFVGVNGLCKLDVLQNLFLNLQAPLFRMDSNLSDIRSWVLGKVGYAQISIESDWDVLIRNVLSGPCLLFLDGFCEALVIDTRTYPARGISEPDTEKVIRGSKDGFVETLLFNANLIRRRIRSPKLTFQITQVGTDSKTDLSIAYIKGLAEESLIHNVLHTLKGIQATSLTMGVKSLEELLLKKHWYHPLPAFFTTERPDVACSYLMEGYILLLVDNTPEVMVLPCSIFQFTQSPEDYYKSFVVGSYIRIIRLFCTFITLFLLPCFLLLAANPSLLPSASSFLITGSFTSMQLFFYVLIAELLLDLFKYSSSHAPGGFSGSFAIIGGLLIGDVAVKLHWASTEVIFYSAATLLASLTLTNIAFSDAIRIYRLFLIILTGLFGLPGFISGVLLIFVSIITTPTFGKKSYFWPLLPFDGKALSTLLIRYPTFKAQPSHACHHKDKAKKTTSP